MTNDQRPMTNDHGKRKSDVRAVSHPCNVFEAQLLLNIVYIGLFLFVISMEEEVMAGKCQRACKGPPSQPVALCCSGTM